MVSKSLGSGRCLSMAHIKTRGEVSADSHIIHMISEQKSAGEASQTNSPIQRLQNRVSLKATHTRTYASNYNEMPLTISVPRKRFLKYTLKMAESERTVPGQRCRTAALQRPQGCSCIHRTDLCCPSSTKVNLSSTNV